MPILISQPVHARLDIAGPPPVHRRPRHPDPLGDLGIDRKSTRLNSSHTVIYTLSLHDALPIYADPHQPARPRPPRHSGPATGSPSAATPRPARRSRHRSEEHTSELQSHSDLHSFPTRRSSDLCRSSSASPSTPAST